MLQDASFSTEVALPCRLAYGPDFALAQSGVTSRIDPRNLIVVLSKTARGPEPQLGDVVELEVLLPGTAKHGKCLRVRAHVVHVSDSGNGERRFHLAFRRASFSEAKHGVRWPEEAVWQM